MKKLINTISYYIDESVIEAFFAILSIIILGILLAAIRIAFQ